MGYPPQNQFWDQRYGDTEDYVFGTAPNDFLAECAPHLPAGPVLCLAEGEGRNAVHLARLGHEVTAIDVSEVGLAKAQKLAASAGVKITTELADLADYDFGVQRWTAVVSIFCHLLPTLRREVHTQVERCLRPGGMFVLEAYAPEQVQHNTGGPVREPERLMDLASVKTEFTNLAWHIARSIERPVLEGPGHTGMAAVTQLFGTVEELK
jgi:SAM-dependent methyltransferase